MSSSEPSRRSIDSNAASVLPISWRARGWHSVSESAERNSRAALSGCSRSWLAAARKRVFDWLARSASALASASARFEPWSAASACSSALVRSRILASSRIAVSNSA